MIGADLMTYGTLAVVILVSTLGSTYGTDTVGVKGVSGTGLAALGTLAIYVGVVAHSAAQVTGSGGCNPNVVALLTADPTLGSSYRIMVSASNSTAGTGVIGGLPSLVVMLVRLEACQEPLVEVRTNVVGVQTTRQYNTALFSPVVQA